MIFNLLLFNFLFVFTPSQELAHLRDTYTYIDHSRPEDGSPSRCDCDYQEVILYLRKDTTFLLTNQIGRLEILQKNHIYGTWKNNTPNEIELQIDSISAIVSRYPILATNKTVTHSTPSMQKLEIKDGNIRYENKILKPSGKVLEQQ